MNEEVLYDKIKQSFVEMGNCFSPFDNDHFEKRMKIEKMAIERQGENYNLGKAIVAYHWEFEVEPLLKSYKSLAGIDEKK